MIDRDRIAYLQELAISHFNDGNIAAAASAWGQVLEMDPSNLEALKGMALADKHVGAPASGPFGAGDEDVAATVTFTPDQMAQLGRPGPAPAAPFGSDFDADSTMVLGAVGSPAPPAAPPPSFDPDRTMQFNPAAPPRLPAAPPAAPAAAAGFDADSTMLFGLPAGGPSPPAAPASTGGFDAERTMLFGTPPPPAAPPPAKAAPVVPPPGPAWPGAIPPPTPAGEFDAESTMIFAAPAAAQPAWTAPPPPQPPSDWLGGAMGGRVESSDSTMMSPEPQASPPPAPPPPSLSFDKAPAAGGRPLEDFVLPTGGLEMTGAPPPPAAPSSGFSFELPPPPAAKAGGGFALPELPSLGPPPAFAPAALPPPPPSAPKKSGAQFGDVDAGEAEALAVPTIGVAHADEERPAGSGDTQAREEELRRSYEQQYGKSQPAGAPPRAGTFGPATVPKSRVGLYVALGFVLLMAATWVVIQYVLPEEKREIVVVPPKVDPNAGLTKEAAQQRIFETLAKAGEAIRSGDITSAAKLIADARDIALKAGIPVPAQVDDAGTDLEKERAYRLKFDKALGRFCAEDYSTANFFFVELEQAKPGDGEPGKYVERIYYNLAISELQKKEPWESVFYFENLLVRNPGDTEAAELLAFAKKWPVGSDLGYEYTKRVDPLVDRTAGCR
jgi:tetratricopeptide (TPR) repeat protein